MELIAIKAATNSDVHYSSLNSMAQKIAYFSHERIFSACYRHKQDDPDLPNAKLVHIDVAIRAQYVIEYAPF